MHILYYYIQLIINNALYIIRATPLSLISTIRLYRHFLSLHNHVDVSGFHCIYIYIYILITLLVVSSFMVYYNACDFYEYQNISHETC